MRGGSLATRTSHRRREVLRGGGTALAALATAGCLGLGGGAGPRVVEMAADFAFDPETVTVDGGATVRWENASDVVHTVTAYGSRIPGDAAYFASGGFDTERAARNDVSGGIVDPGDAYEHTFERAGAHEYFCVPHEGSGMVGTIRVR